MHQCWQIDAIKRPNAIRLSEASRSRTALSLVDTLKLPASGDIMAVCFAPGCHDNSEAMMSLMTSMGSYVSRRSPDRLWLSLLTSGLASMILVLSYDGTSTAMQVSHQ